MKKIPIRRLSVVLAVGAFLGGGGGAMKGALGGAAMAVEPADLSARD